MVSTLKLKYMFYYLFHKSFLSFYHFDVFINNHSKIFGTFISLNQNPFVMEENIYQIRFSESDTSLREEWIESLRVLKFEKTYYFCYYVGFFRESLKTLSKRFLEGHQNQTKDRFSDSILSNICFEI